MEQEIPAGRRTKAGMPPVLLLRIDLPALFWGSVSVDVFKRPPFINKFLSSFPHLPTFSFLTRFFVHSRTFPASGWFDFPPARVSGAEVPSWQHWWHAGHRGLRKRDSHPLPPSWCGAPRPAAPNSPAHCSATRHWKHPESWVTVRPLLPAAL